MQSSEIKWNKVKPIELKWNQVSASQTRWIQERPLPPHQTPIQLYLALSVYIYRDHTYIYTHTYIYIYIYTSRLRPQSPGESAFAKLHKVSSQVSKGCACQLVSRLSLSSISSLECASHHTWHQRSGAARPARQKPRAGPRARQNPRAAVAAGGLSIRRLQRSWHSMQRNGHWVQKLGWLMQKLGLLLQSNRHQPEIRSWMPWGTWGQTKPWLWSKGSLCSTSCLSPKFDHWLFWRRCFDHPPVFQRHWSELVGSCCY